MTNKSNEVLWLKETGCRTRNGTEKGYAVMEFVAIAIVVPTALV